MHVAEELDRWRGGDPGRAARAGTVVRQIINIPPRCGKSTASSVALVAWHLGHHPDANIICVSYAQDFAEKLARDCLSVMTSETTRGKNLGGSNTVAVGKRIRLSY